MNDAPKPDPEKHGSHLLPLTIRGSVVGWSLVGLAVSALGLFLLTGLAATPWLLLLYPLVIGVMLVSLCALALHLLHRL